MVCRRSVALVSFVIVLSALVFVPSCTECADGGEGCSCTSSFECTQFPNGCYAAYCDGTCHFVEFPIGSSCGMDPCSAPGPCKQGFCNAEPNCVECLEDSHCGAGHTCEPGNVCSRCDDGMKNGDESGVDCGGSCPLCPGKCGVDVDCPGGYCWQGLCVSCNDGIKNGDETGIDCGVFQGHCPICFGLHCASNDDCASKTCENGYCCATSCPLCYKCGFPVGECVPVPYGLGDVFNAAEPNVICYGKDVCDGNGRCALTFEQPCSKDDECASNRCINGLCDS